MSKGSVLDVIVGVALIFIVSISMIIFSFGNSVVMGAFENNTATNQSTAKARTYMNDFFNTFNYGFLFVYFGTLLTVGILAYYSNMNPLFYPISGLVMIIAIFLSIFLAEAYNTVVNSNANFTALAEQYWIMTFIMKNLPFFTAIFDGFVGLMTYLGKRGNRSGGI